MHWPIQELGAWLTSVIVGHDRSDGVPRTMGMLRVFRARILRYWCRTIRRRSQRHHLTWQRMYPLATPWLPAPHMMHPYPAPRLRVPTQGRSPVRECRTPGSVRAVTRSPETWSDPRGWEAKVTLTFDNLMCGWVRTCVLLPPQRCTGDGSTRMTSPDTRRHGSRLGCKAGGPRA